MPFYLVFLVTQDSIIDDSTTLDSNMIKMLRNEDPVIPILVNIQETSVSSNSVSVVSVEENENEVTEQDVTIMELNNKLEISNIMLKNNLNI